MKDYPYNSAYAFSENRVIDGVELEGLEVVSYAVKFNDQGKSFLQLTNQRDGVACNCFWTAYITHEGKTISGGGGSIGLEKFFAVLFKDPNIIKNNGPIGRNSHLIGKTKEEINAIFNVTETAAETKARHDKETEDEIVGLFQDGVTMAYGMKNGGLGKPKAKTQTNQAPKKNAPTTTVSQSARKVGNLEGGPLQGASQVSGRFKLEGGPKNGTVYRANTKGEITSYAVYDKQGMITKRVDVTGAAHKGVATPHVVEYGRNTYTNSQGQTVTRVQSPNTKSAPRKATPAEIP